ncbi:MAG TPA: sodium:solute symporter family protein [Longimicrobiaceae bacterium]|nr:sodium:solute symporter family protein [Longimicrobiaceae bacterium]
MTWIDWAIVAVYMAASLGIGLYLARRASTSMVDFFVGGRTLPWWLAGTSMAATTFSIDTPLYVAGLVGSRGIAGNWEWWNFAIAHVILIYVFARLWRRAEIVTDNELSELRYGGRPAAALRLTKSFLFAVVFGSIGIGYAMLAMVKVIDALGLLPSLGLTLGDQGKLWSVIIVSVLVLAYAGVAGLWGVVATDFFQFFLGLFGAIVVAVVAVSAQGGLGVVAERAQEFTRFDMLSFTPLTWGETGLVGWSTLAGISGSTFMAYVFVQWWAFRRSDGGGEFVQRLAGCRDEAEAEKAAWFFNVMNYVVRTWPWVIVAVVAVVVFPDLEDRELGYPLLMLEYLPTGLLGLVVASLIAAFMSTVSTLINWGASYLTNDVYARFLRPGADQAELVAAARVASVLVTALGATAAFFSEDVGKVFQLTIAIGTGPGVVLILRWFWWRINAWAELAAMVAGFLVGFGTTVVPVLQIQDFGLRLVTTLAITFLIWFPVMLLTRPESDEKLDSFYLRVRPGGPGWRRQRERTGVLPVQDLGQDLLRVLAGLMLLFGTMFAIGSLLFLRWTSLAMMLVLALAGWLWLRRLGESVPAPPLPEPPTHPSPGRP